MTRPTDKARGTVKRILVRFRGPILAALALILARFALRLTVPAGGWNLFTIYGNAIIDLLNAGVLIWVIAILLGAGMRTTHEQMKEHKKIKK